VTSFRAVHRLVAGAFAVLFFAASLHAQARPVLTDAFQVGDRILLRVAGEAQLTDTFTVAAGPLVNLPIVGTVSLVGVRRDSVEKVLLEAISKFYRDPIVHARALVSVAVLGEVLRPGFYAVPSDMRFPDVLMVAGGPTPTAKVDAMRVTRSGAELLSVDSTKKAVANGLTLSQIGIQAEDQFFVPRVADPERALRIVSALVALPIAILTILLIRR
jgi:protein involved in polysaccharide export with SLBB domain